MNKTARPPQPDEIAHRLRAASHGDGASAVARRTGASRETTRRYLTNGQPSVGFLAEFCLAYDVNPAWLVFGRDPMRLVTARDTGPTAYATAELIEELHRRLSGPEMPAPTEDETQPHSLIGADLPRRFPPLQSPDDKAT